MTTSPHIASPPKMTVRDALPDAERVLGDSSHVLLVDFMAKMRAAQVEPMAARATLCFLEATGKLAFESMSDIRVFTGR